MAKKDVIEYYNKVKNNYDEMVDNLNVWSEQLEKELISPEYFKKKSDELDIIKNNYFRINYIIYLLNKPGKFQQFINKVVKKLYKLTSRKVEFKGPESAKLEAVEAENKEALKNMKL